MLFEASDTCMPLARARTHDRAPAQRCSRRALPFVPFSLSADACNSLSLSPSFSPVRARARSYVDITHVYARVYTRGTPRIKMRPADKGGPRALRSHARAIHSPGNTNDRRLPVLQARALCTASPPSSSSTSSRPFDFMTSSPAFHFLFSRLARARAHV